ncbi:MAG: hypothetical protein IJO32_04685 [Bacilli bacterium]|nr:hypothetical protein [Bacilli bacterium]
MIKEAKTLKNDAIFFLVLILIIIFLSILGGNSILNALLIALFNGIFSVAIYIGANNQQKYAGICGVVYGFLLILTLSLETILGIFLIIHSIKYLKVIK